MTLAPFIAPAQAGDCRQSALQQLRALAPDGYSIYKATKDKAFFTNWITCDDVPLGLSTAVHESVHYITSEDDAFPLVNGGEIKRPHEVSSFFAPALIAKKFKASDFVSTYLRPGKSSSATDFLYLLDELNAYSHDLKAAINLNSIRPADQDVDNRDGLAAAMAFVALYAETAEESQPATWSGLQKPDTADIVAELWGNAEKVMSSSCGIPNFGAEDKMFIRQFCQAKVQSSLAKIIGRAPVCPIACLKPTPEAEQTSTEEVETPADGALSPRAAAKLSSVRLFWSSRSNRHSSRSGDAEGEETTTTR